MRRTAEASASIRADEDAFGGRCERAEPWGPPRGQTGRRPRTGPAGFSALCPPSATKLRGRGEGEVVRELDEAHDVEVVGRTEEDLVHAEPVARAEQHPQRREHRQHRHQPQQLCRAAGDEVGQPAGAEARGQLDLGAKVVLEVLRRHRHLLLAINQARRVVGAHRRHHAGGISIIVRIVIEVAGVSERVVVLGLEQGGRWVLHA